MGLFTGLLTLPVLPVRGVVWISEQVQRQAEQADESRTAASTMQRLTDIEEAWQAGELSDERRAELESEVLGELVTRGHGDW